MLHKPKLTKEWIEQNLLFESEETANVKLRWYFPNLTGKFNPLDHSYDIFNEDGELVASIGPSGSELHRAA